MVKNKKIIKKEIKKQLTIGRTHIRLWKAMPKAIIATTTTTIIIIFVCYDLVCICHSVTEWHPQLTQCQAKAHPPQSFPFAIAKGV